MRRVLILSALLCLSACDRTPANGEAKGGEAKADKPQAAGLRLDAAGTPRFRAGLWEVVQSGDGDENGKHKQCIGEESNAEMRKMLTDGAKDGCKMSRSSDTGGFHAKSECKTGPSTVYTDMVMTGSDTAYDLTIDLAMDNGQGKTPVGKLKAAARWIGACPPGVKPGDEIAD